MTRTLHREAHGQTASDTDYHKHVAKFWEEDEPVTWTVSRHLAASNPAMLVVHFDGNRDYARQGYFELTPDSGDHGQGTRSWRQLDGNLIDLLPPAVLDAMWKEVLR